MHDYDIQINMVDRATIADARQIADIAKEWPSQFIPEAVDAICRDAQRFPCYLVKREKTILAFLIISPASLELELLWSAASKSCFRRAHYIRIMVEAAEKDFFTDSPLCMLSYAKMSASNAVIPGNTNFKGDASRNMRRLVMKMGYIQEYSLESYWQPENHCILMVKRKAISI